MFRSQTLVTLVTVLLATLVLQSTADAASSKHRVRARLFGETPMKGQARYEEKPKSGQTLRRFKVEVQQAMPFQNYVVAVNGNVVGTLTTSALGKGKFELRTAAFIDSPGDGLPMPTDFPKLDTGDTVTVGSLSGTIFDQQDSSVQRVRFRGEFDASASGKADYRERFKKGQLERRFKIEIEDAPVGTSYDLYVNGQFIDTIVIGGGPETKYQLRTAAFIDSPGDGQPMPNSFPSIKDGDVVTLGPYTMVMEPKD